MQSLGTAARAWPGLRCRGGGAGGPAGAAGPAEGRPPSDGGCEPRECLARAPTFSAYWRLLPSRLPARSQISPVASPHPESSVEGNLGKCNSSRAELLRCKAAPVSPVSIWRPSAPLLTALNFQIKTSRITAQVNVIPLYLYHGKPPSAPGDTESLYRLWGDTHSLPAEPYSPLGEPVASTWRSTASCGWVVGSGRGEEGNLFIHTQITGKVHNESRPHFYSQPMVIPCIYNFMLPSPSASTLVDHPVR